MFQSVAPVNYLSRITRGDAVLRHVFRHDRSGSDNRSGANSNTVQNDDAESQPRTISNLNTAPGLKRLLFNQSVGLEAVIVGIKRASGRYCYVSTDLHTAFVSHDLAA